MIINLDMSREQLLEVIEVLDDAADQVPSSHSKCVLGALSQELHSQLEEGDVTNGEVL